MALEDDLEALCSAPPAEFVDRRKALAQALRKAGRKEDAAAVAGAAKPTPAAWAVNQLAHRHPDEIASLMSLGEALRIRLRAAFSGRGDAAATAEAQAAQRDSVARLTRLAATLLEGAGVSSSAVVLERVAATLTAISTTGKWGDEAPRRLTRELDPPGIEALAALVEDLATAPESISPGAENTMSGGRAGPPAGSVPSRGTATDGRAHRERATRGTATDDRAHREEATRGTATDERARREGATGRTATEERARQEEAARRAAEQERARQEEAARRAAEEARERVRRAEAALQSAATAEEQARIAAEAARAALTLVTATRADREAAAREARRVAKELQEAADEARRKAEAAARAATESEATATQAARAEASAKADLAAAEQAVTRAAAEHTAAEEALVRERRRQQAAAPPQR